MDCPGFSVLNYGIYQLQARSPKPTPTQPRVLARFELELIDQTLDGIAYMDHRAYPLKSGLLLCGKPGQRRYSLPPVRCHYVHLTTQDPGLLQLLQALPDSCLLSTPEPVLALFQQLTALPQDADPLLIGSLVLRLLVLVRQLTATELQTEDTLSRSHKALLLQTRDYICSHLAEPLTLEQLAGRVRFSPAHFHRIFTAFFRQTPHEFVLASRIRAAQAALRSDRSSLIEVAACCGFSSQSHFTAQFKKATGQTPLQYRKKMLSQPEP